MENIKTLVNNHVFAKKKLEEIVKQKDNLRAKETNLHQTLTNLDSQISTADSELKTAIERLAYDEITDQDFKNIKTKHNEIKEKREEISSLLKVVKEKLEIKSDLESCNDAVELAETEIWRHIAQKEIARVIDEAVPLLLRAYFAETKSYPRADFRSGMLFEHFFEERIIKSKFKYFSEVSTEAAKYEADLLKQYLR